MGTSYDWTDLFNPSILSRGYYYYKNDAVRDLKVQDNVILAVVEGTHDYVVKIKLDSEGEIASMECDCPYGERCKHEAAVLYCCDSFFYSGSMPQDYPDVANFPGVDSPDYKENCLDDIVPISHTNVFRDVWSSLPKLPEKFHLSVLNELGHDFLTAALNKIYSRENLVWIFQAKELLLFAFHPQTKYGKIDSGTVYYRAFRYHKGEIDYSPEALKRDRLLLMSVLCLDKVIDANISLAPKNSSEVERAIETFCDWYDKRTYKSKSPLFKFPYPNLAFKDLVKGIIETCYAPAYKTVKVELPRPFDSILENKALDRKCLNLLYKAVVEIKNGSSEFDYQYKVWRLTSDLAAVLVEAYRLGLYRKFPILPPESLVENKKALDDVLNRIYRLSIKDIQDARISYISHHPTAALEGELETSVKDVELPSQNVSESTTRLILSLAEKNNDHDKIDLCYLQLMLYYDRPEDIVEHYFKLGKLKFTVLNSKYSRGNSGRELFREWREFFIGNPNFGDICSLDSPALQRFLEEASQDEKDCFASRLENSVEPLLRKEVNNYSGYPFDSLACLYNYFPEVMGKLICAIFADGAPTLNSHNATGIYPVYLAAMNDNGALAETKFHIFQERSDDDVSSKQ